MLNSEFIISGYSCFRQDRRVELFENNIFVNEARGGVLLLIKDDLHPVHVDFDVGAELVTCTIRPKDYEPLCICCVYRPEAAGLPYLNRICRFINDYDHENIFIVGDFNFSL